MKEENKEYLVNTMAGSMKPCRSDIKERMINLCTKIHPEFGQRLAKGLGMSADTPAKL
jgi:catalase